MRETHEEGESESGFQGLSFNSGLLGGWTQSGVGTRGHGIWAQRQGQ